MDSSSNTCLNLGFFLLSSRTNLTINTDHRFSLYRTTFLVALLGFIISVGNK